MPLPTDPWRTPRPGSPRLPLGRTLRLGIELALSRDYACAEVSVHSWQQWCASNRATPRLAKLHDRAPSCSLSSSCIYKALGMAPILKLALVGSLGRVGERAGAGQHAAGVAQARAPGVRHRRRRRARRRDALRAAGRGADAGGEGRAVPGVQGEEGAQAGPPPREQLLGQGPRC